MTSTGSGIFPGVFTSVFPVRPSPVQQVALLMRALKERITRASLSQTEAARLLGVTQPRVSDLMRGKIHLFALDALVNMAVAAGLHIDLQVREVA